MLAFLYAFMALPFNMLCGYCGYFSLRHHAYFGIGAYVTMILILWFDITPWIGMIVSGIVGAAIALGVSFPLFKLKSHWFTLATLAFAEIVKLIFLNWESLGAGRGLQVPIKPESLYWLTFAGPTVYYYCILAMLAIEAIILYRIVKSKIGYCLQIIREDEYTAMSVGINPIKYKTIAMVIGGFFFGIAGGFYTAKYRFIDPFSVVDFMWSVEIALCTIIGGLYSFIGPVVGSLITIPVAYYVRSAFGGPLGGKFLGIHRLIYGCILLAVMLWASEGIMGWIEKRGYHAKMK
jgi:branched-chain amino acid transport system permease protein